MPPASPTPKATSTSTRTPKPTRTPLPTDTPAPEFTATPRPPKVGTRSNPIPVGQPIEFTGFVAEHAGGGQVCAHDPQIAIEGKQGFRDRASLISELLFERYQGIAKIGYCSLLEADLKRGVAEIGHHGH